MQKISKIFLIFLIIIFAYTKYIQIREMDFYENALKLSKSLSEKNPSMPEHKFIINMPSELAKKYPGENISSVLTIMILEMDDFFSGKLAFSNAIYNVKNPKFPFKFNLSPGEFDNYKSSFQQIVLAYCYNQNSSSCSYSSNPRIIGSSFFYVKNGSIEAENPTNISLQSSFMPNSSFPSITGNIVAKGTVNIEKKLLNSNSKYIFLAYSKKYAKNHKFGFPLQRIIYQQVVPNRSKFSFTISKNQISEPSYVGFLSFLLLECAEIDNCTKDFLLNLKSSQKKNLMVHTPIFLSGQLSKVGDQNIMLSF